MSRNFDGVDDVVYAAMAQAVADFTISFWANADSEGEGANGYFFGHTDGVRAMRFEFWGGGINRPRFLINFGSAAVADGIDNDITLGVWQHWAVRYRTSDDLKEILRNGTVIASSTTDPGATGISNNNFCIGAGTGSGANAFDGKIADCRRWSVRLTDDEIKMAMRGQIVRPNSVNLWWLLYGNSSPEPDWSGNIKNGTVTGAVQADHPPVAVSFGMDLGWRGAFTSISQYQSTYLGHNNFGHRSLGYRGLS